MKSQAEVTNVTQSKIEFVSIDKQDSLPQQHVDHMSMWTVQGKTMGQLQQGQRGTRPRERQKTDSVCLDAFFMVFMNTRLRENNNVSIGRHRR